MERKYSIYSQLPKVSVALLARRWSIARHLCMETLLYNTGRGHGGLKPSLRLTVRIANGRFAQGFRQLADQRGELTNMFLAPESSSWGTSSSRRWCRPPPSSAPDSVAEGEQTGGSQTRAIGGKRADRRRHQRLFPRVQFNITTPVIKL